jgi:hypothetical protein
MQPDERVRMWADRLERHINELEAWSTQGQLQYPGDIADLMDIIDRLDALRHDMTYAVTP